MAAAGKSFKVDVKSNALQVLAVTRENGKLLPAALAAALTNLALAGIEQAELNGIVRGHENPKKDSWFALPIPGATDPTAKPTAFDFKNHAVKMSNFVRDSKGHILGRTVERSGPQFGYLFRDKVVSRTGEYYDDMSFENDPSVRGTQLDPAMLREQFLLSSNLGGLEISAIGSEVLLRTTATNEGNKIATLEKRGTQSGRGRPRYIIRRALQSVTKRYSTTMKKEMAKAAKLAAQAKASA